MARLSPMWQSLSPNVQGLLLTALAGLSYFLTYRVNELFDPWVLFAQGINLVYVPAGIKHLAILLAGRWGALGCLLALFTVAGEFWQGVPTGQIALYSAISTGATWIGILLSMRLLGISKDLHNLQFMQLPMMDLITTAIHGFTTNAFFMLAGMKSENFLENALAMMFGDFTGSFILLTLLWLGLALLKRKRALEVDID